MIYPYFVLNFKLSETAKSIYFLAGAEVDKEAAERVIEKMPAKIRKPYTGMKYIEMDDTQHNPQAKDPFCFSMGQHISPSDGKLHHARFTGFQRFPKYPNCTYGNDNNWYMQGNDAIIILWGDGGKTLKTFFFRGKSGQEKALFERWTAGELCLIVDPQPIRQEESPAAVQGYCSRAL